jgi:hypothetical protein
MELEKIPDLVRRESALMLIEPLDQLFFTPEVEETMEFYFKHHLMPSEALGDAAHLALASVFQCDMLVTWNCRHLANPNKARHIAHVNSLLGLKSPLLVTPFELLNANEI